MAYFYSKRHRYDTDMVTRRFFKNLGHEHDKDDDGSFVQI